MSFLIVFRTFVRVFLCCFRKMFAKLVLLITFCPKVFANFGWRVFNVFRVDYRKVATDAGVVEGARVITQIGADYSRCGVVLSLRQSLAGQVKHKVDGSWDDSGSTSQSFKKPLPIKCE
ncbi:uncharacterized protein LOC123876091 [Maniola jurtina]|uniref:uncharacterized protein LOC123876091 n=1 Tax=Maniola jurtina TaxID=191418 RepID=UPI001E68B764|nr:uncharacterized protein LOC123876091 [Maniola jurtina]